MRRSLTILKYLPAVLCGLLVVAWVVSPFLIVDADFPWQPKERWGVTGIEIKNATLSVWWDARRGGTLSLGMRENRWHMPHLWLGEFRYDNSIYTSPSRLKVPFPLLTTLALPLAIGPFIRFRFPLWSWFVFVAVVAGELAWYLR